MTISKLKAVDVASQIAVSNHLQELRLYYSLQRIYHAHPSTVVELVATVREHFSNQVILWHANPL
jgi:hypothetical protein